MPGALRIALIAGVILALAYLTLCWSRSKRLQAADICDAVALALTPFPLPGAVAMIWKAFGSETLPIFNSAEDRVALVIGGSLLIAAFVYGLVSALKRAGVNEGS